MKRPGHREMPSLSLTIFKVLTWTNQVKGFEVIDFIAFKPRP